MQIHRRRNHNPGNHTPSAKNRQKCRPVMKLPLSLQKESLLRLPIIRVALDPGNSAVWQHHHENDVPAIRIVGLFREGNHRRLFVISRIIAYFDGIPSPKGRPPESAALQWKAYGIVSAQYSQGEDCRHSKSSTWEVPLSGCRFHHSDRLSSGSFPELRDGGFYRSCWLWGTARPPRKRPHCVITAR